jgi:glycine/D-amino acid oxidase-like deaminating enzyme
VQRDGYRIGATHDWDDHDPTPTAAARTYLLEQAQLMVAKEIIVTGHRAAIRPSTQFKRPLAGSHPERTGQYVFTGLGTKGALQAPWAARQLVEHMLDDKPLDQEIDIMRWWGVAR